MEGRLIGEYLISQRKLTPTQLQNALTRQAEQRHSGHMPLIGTVLVKMGAIRSDDLTFALAEQERDRMRVSN
jgi:hypothetical protein